MERLGGWPGWPGGGLSSVPDQPTAHNWGRSQIKAFAGPQTAAVRVVLQRASRRPKAASYSPPSSMGAHTTPKHSRHVLDVSGTGLASAMPRRQPSLQAPGPVQIPSRRSQRWQGVGDAAPLPVHSCNLAALGTGPPLAKPPFGSEPLGLPIPPLECRRWGALCAAPTGARASARQPTQASGTHAAGLGWRGRRSLAVLLRVWSPLGIVLTSQPIAAPPRPLDSAGSATAATARPIEGSARRRSFWMHSRHSTRPPPLPPAPASESGNLAHQCRRRLACPLRRQQRQRRQPTGPLKHGGCASQCRCHP